MYPKLSTKGDEIVKTKKKLQPFWNPLILSPIDQVLGSWTTESLLPPPELLVSKMRKQKREPNVQFANENDPLQVKLNDLLLATDDAHKKQKRILKNLMLLKDYGVEEGIELPANILINNLCDFIKENKLLITLCKRVEYS